MKGNMKKTVIASLLVLAMALTACQSASTQTTAPATTEESKIASSTEAETKAAATEASSKESASATEKETKAESKTEASTEASESSSESESQSVTETETQKSTEKQTTKETTQVATTEAETTKAATTEAETTSAPKEIKRQAAIHTYTSFADGSGYAKLTDYSDSDLYISVSQVSDYAVFYGYSMEGYYNIYPQYFQEGDTDYFQLLKTAIGTDTFKQVNSTIKGYLQKIASLYYGKSYESYWTYFCYIPEDSQEYQQLYDAKGVAKITGYDQSDLYISTKSVLSYAYYGYTMDQYYKWYESYGYFKVDGVDYYAKLVTAMGDKLYAPVTDEIKDILKKISLAYWKSESYWTYFCSVKTSIIPEGKYETVTTDYYKILEAECGHNTFVKVNSKIKEALQYLSKSFYGDAQYWDYWCYTTYDVTGETKEASEYTTLVGTDGEYKTIDYEDSDLYVNLDVTFDFTWNYGGGQAYTMAQWYSYGGTYSGNFIKTEVVEVD